MRIRLGMGLQQLRARLEVDEPYFDMALIDGRPTIWGNCDISNAETIEVWLVAFGRAAIDVDLSGVTFLDAAALRALLAVAKRNPNMRIVKASPSVQRVLDLTDTNGCLVDGTSFS
jgi:anti-anti-sigma factor